MRARTLILLGACFASLAAGGFALGQHAKKADGAVATRATAPSTEYRIVTLVELLKDVLPAGVKDFDESPKLEARWENIGSEVGRSQSAPRPAAAPQPAPEPRIGEIEVQRRVVAEINRLGADGWELCAVPSDAWPKEVSRFGVLYFRRAH